MRSKRTNLGLFALVILLALVAYYEPGMEKSAEKIPLTNLKPEEVYFIRINDNHGRDLIMQKQQGSWFITSPYKKPADKQRIHQLLKITTAASLSRFAAPTVRLAEFGLNPPPIHLQLNDTKLGVGGVEPIQFRRYVLIDQQLHLISNGYHHHLIAPAEHFVRKTETP